MTAGPVETGIERIRIRNYRVLGDVELDGLTPVTALVGPNGSGKSTVFDALGLVAEALGGGLEAAWSRRDGLSEIRSRELAGPVEIEVACRREGALFEYVVVLDEDDDGPVAVRERLSWSPGDPESLIGVLDFGRGVGRVRRPGEQGWRDEELASARILAAGVFGQLLGNAHLGQFLGLMGRVQLIDLDVSAMRSGTRGVRRGTGLDPRGDNIAMRVETLRDEHAGEWAEVLRALRRYVPGLEDILPLRLGDGSHIVRLKEKGSAEPILPENISDGTMLLLGYLVALRSPLAVLLLEEPENQVHPRLHYLLAEDARGGAADQVIAATHSPRFVDALRPDEVWAFAKADDGYAEVKRASDEAPVARMAEAGAALGELWTEGYFRFGDPLVERP
ncbi:AAA family ATPase [Amycolatopsis silviterrae]|uniref:AAA family ATPase n=1 Tax=Amycolatopsis silviterrae TaxID=1656914 RepID=A0ABW5HF63_9PSEU